MALRSIPALIVVLALALGCAPADPEYRATIRRTSHGIPHIEAADYGSLGFGEGYAFAQDHLCSLADQIVRARGERARYFGRGPNDAHLNSDFALKGLDLAGRATAELEAERPDVRDWFSGYVAGYNAFLAETGVDAVAGWCRGAEWVRPITTEDLFAYQRLVVTLAGYFTDMIATAAPPAAEQAVASTVALPRPDMASNGWAIGAERSASGGGMLLANPHYPWLGSNRFWEKHLTIPGRLDVYGVHLLGVPGVAIGFNRSVAWTHTVSAGERFTLYSLSLVPGDPTRYLYDGEERAMTSRDVTVEVRNDDGSVEELTRTLYSSHYGPMINFPGFEWSAERALSLRNANRDNDEARAQWVDMNHAAGMDEFQRIHADHNAMPWVNTIAASADGRAWYTDSSATPNLSDQAIELWLERLESDRATAGFYQRGLVLLDGSDSRFEWQTDPEARDPGVVSGRRMPQLERPDFVFNANDSYWLANPAELVTGFSPLHGREGTPRSLRTRMNALVLSDGSADGAYGADGRLSLDELAAAALNNRALAAELLLDEVVERCRQAGAADLAAACDALAGYDGRLDLDSAGAVLWREFVTRFEIADTLDAGALFARPFDPADAVATPAGLAPPRNGRDQVLEALAGAANLLERQGIALDAALGELQHASRNGRRIPIHGGLGGWEGVTNFVRPGGNQTTLEPHDAAPPLEGSRTLTADGYPVTSGTSFIMALEYADSGPRARAFLTYSQSGDPTSPRFFDQTELFSRKEWRPILFELEEIEADPELEVLEVSAPIASSHP